MTKDSIAKSIVITGASSGIGREIALEMASDGHSFVLLGGNKEGLERVKREVDTAGHRLS
jgi:short-subunit dehydrogenase